MSDISNGTAELNDGEFRAFILILAEANEQRAQEKDDCIVVSKTRFNSLAPNRRNTCGDGMKIIHSLALKQGSVCLGS